MSVETRDILLGVMGVLTVLWCGGLTAYVLVSDARRQAASWDAIVRAFSLQLAKLGDDIRSGKVAP